MTIFNSKFPPELLIAGSANNGFGTNGGDFMNGLVLFAIAVSLKKPWEYDN